jgi:hypothetical protein
VQYQEEGKMFRAHLKEFPHLPGGHWHETKEEAKGDLFIGLWGVYNFLRDEEAILDGVPKEDLERFKEIISSSLAK